MWNAFFISVASLSLLAGSGTDLVLRPKTVLVYETRSGKEESQFVLRLARYHPDIFLEWESTSHQGTLHLYRKAVTEGKTFSLAGLFQIGVDMISEDTMTTWLSRRMYEDLVSDGEAKVVFNNHPVKLNVTGEGTYALRLNKVPQEISVIFVEDDRKGKWSLHKNPDNPILVEYESPYYRQRLKSVSTNAENRLRWIRKLPPVR